MGEYDFSTPLKEEEKDPVEKLVRPVLDQKYDFTTPLETPRVATQDALSTDPTQHQKNLALSNSLGVPVNMVEDDVDGNLEAFRREMRIDEISRKSPATGKFLKKDPDNMKLGHKDAENLSAIEKIVDDGFELLGNAFDTAVVGASRGLQAFEAGVIEKGIGITIHGAGETYSAVGSLTNTALRNVGLGAVADADEWLQENLPWWAQPGQILKRPGKTIKEFGKSLDVAPEHQNIATDIVGGFGQIVSQVAMRLVSAPLSAVALFGMGADIMAERAEASEADQTTKDLSVLSGGAITAITEKYGLDFLLRKVPAAVRNSFLKKVADVFISGGGEAVQELVEGLAHDVVTKLSLDENKEIGEGVLREMTAAGGAGGLFRTMVLGAVGVKGAYRSRQIRKHAETVTQNIKDANAQESELRDLSPEKFGEAMAGDFEKHGVEAAHLTGEGAAILNQTLGEDSPLDAAEVTEAVASGGTVQLSLEQYWSMPREVIDQVAEHTSFSSSELSEIEAIEADNFINTVGKISPEDIEAEKALIGENSELFNKIYDLMLSSGSLISDPAVGRANAENMTATFSIMSKRSGVDLQTVFDTFMPSVMKRSIEEAQAGEARAAPAPPAQFNPETDSVTLPEGAGMPPGLVAEMSLEGEPTTVRLADAPVAPEQQDFDSVEDFLKAQNVYEEALRDREAAITFLEQQAAQESAGGVELPAFLRDFRILDQGGSLQDTSPEFQQWFGESQAVTPDGQPLLAAHATLDDDITVFDTAGFGTHIGQVKQANQRLRDIANKGSGLILDRNLPGSNVMPVYLSIQNPLRMPDVGVWRDSAAVADALIQMDINRDDVIEIREEAEDIKSQFTYSEFSEDQLVDEDGNEIRVSPDASPWTESQENRDLLDELQSIIEFAGYDGVVYENAVEGQGDSFIPFDPTQIKSPFNEGTYDPNEADILKQEDQTQQTIDEVAETLGPAAAAGVKIDVDSGSTVFNNEDAARSMAEDGTVLFQGVEKPVGGRFMRGKPKRKPKGRADQVVAAALDDSVIRSEDDIGTVAEALEIADQYETLTPIVLDRNVKLRYDKNKGKNKGYYGNEKMEFPSEAYPQGRNSWDVPGCGRLHWAIENKQDMKKACYSMGDAPASCYAEQLKKAKQGNVASVTSNVDKRPLLNSKANHNYRDTVIDLWVEMGKEHEAFQAVKKKYGRNYDIQLSAVTLAKDRKPVLDLFNNMVFSGATRQEALNEVIARFPKFRIAENPKGGLNMFKLSVGYYVSASGERLTRAQARKYHSPAVVSTNLKNAEGIDIRLGVDTDGSAWLADESVMDAIIEANPRSVNVYSSAYHRAPPPHELSRRTIINVTVSGWHPLPETLARLKWAEEARANGWVVILREVVANPAQFGEETAAVYNRFHEALLKTDFFMMQQPLHVGKKHGELMWGLPGCCVGSKKNPHTCDGCEVTEGLGREFQEYWNIAEENTEEETILPDSPYKGRQLFQSDRATATSPAYADFGERKVRSEIGSAHPGDDGTADKHFTRMSIDDFLKLTVSSEEEISKIEEEGPKTSNIKPYDDVDASGFSPEEFDLEGGFAVPFLNVTPQGKVVGHEGRHRAVLLKKDGATTMPVVLQMRGESFAEEHGPAPTSLTGQFNESAVVQVSSIVAHGNNFDAIMDLVGPKRLFQGGLFSPSRRAVETAPQEKATGEQWKSRIEQSAGTSKEMIWIPGLEELLSAKGTISKEDLAAFIEQNGIKMEEVALGGEFVPVETDRYEVLEMGEGSYVVVDHNGAPIPEQVEDAAFLERIYDTEETAQAAIATLVAEDLQEAADTADAAPAGAPVFVNDYATEQEVLDQAFGDNMLMNEADELLPNLQILQNIDGSWNLFDINAEPEAGADWIGRENRINELINLNIERMEADGVAVGLTPEEDAELQDLRAQQNAVEPDHPENLSPRFTRWNTGMKGGTNHREFYLTLPAEASPANAKMEDWLVPSAHQTGIPLADKRLIVRIRVSDFVDADGNKTLLIQEMQNDRGQVGGEKGFVGEPTFYRVKDVIGRNVGPKFATMDEAMAYLNGRSDGVSVATIIPSVPPMPFPIPSEWVPLVLKRVLLTATEEGYDSISWTPGEVQAERYDLSAVLESLEYSKEENGTYNLHGYQEGGGRKVIDEMGIEEKDLANYVGKELADKMIAGKGEERGIRKQFSGLDLKVGGEGLKRLYDKTVVNSANKLVDRILGKKSGVKVGVANVAAKGDVYQVREHELFGYVVVASNGQPLRNADGETIKWDNRKAAENRAAKESAASGQPTKEVWTLPITEKMRETVGEEGFSLFHEEVRGSFDPRDPNNLIINLFNAENLSTFLHESSHLYLHMMGKLVDLPGANEQFRQDYMTILDYLEVTKPSDLVVMTDAADDPARLRHEKFADTWETYLKEGKAPSVELMGAFARFSSWLTRIYGAVTDVRRSEISPEIREVFDRMLATDEQIEEAREVSRMMPLFKDVEAAGWTEKEHADYEASIQRSAESQKAELVARSFRDVKRENTKWWNEEKAGEYEDILKRLDEDPVWRARYILQHGRLPSGEELPEDMLPMKLSSESIKTMENADKYRALPGGTNMLNKKTGGHPDQIADVLGFRSGDEMMQALVGMPRDESGTFLTEKQFAEQEAELRMRERHGDIMTDGTMHEEALMRVHSESQAQVIMREIRQLNKLTGRSGSPTNKVVKAAAKRMIAERSLDQIINHRSYLNAETRAAAQSIDLALKGDFEGALLAKQKQLLNFHLYRQARNAADKIDGMTTRLNRWQNKKLDPKNINPDFIRQVKELLAGISFGPKISQDRFDKLATATLKEWADEQTKTYGARFHMPAQLEAALEKANYRDMTFDEFQGLHDTAKSIVEMGRKYNEAENAQFNSMVENTSDSILANAPKIKKFVLEHGRFGSFGKWGRRFLANHRRIFDLAEELDGFVRGIVLENVYLPIKRSNDRYLDRSTIAGEQLAEIFDAYTFKEKWRFYDRMHIEEIGQDVSLGTRLMFALNMGNAGNVEAMLNKDTGYTEEQINAVLATLSDKDWDVVEALAKHIEQYWNDQVDENGNVVWGGIASLEERMTGVIPARVEPVPFVTPHGRTMPGWYFPLVADPRGGKGLDDMDARNSLDGFLGGGHAKASTKHGSTIERVGWGNERRVWLDLRVIFMHVDGVIKDIEMREAVHTTHRIIKHKKFNDAVTAVKGEEGAVQFTSWLENVIGGNKPPKDPYEEAILWARAGVSVAEMGFSLRTMLQQPVGTTQSAAYLGEKYWAIGWAKYMKGMNPHGGEGAGGWIANDAVQGVMELSAFMRNRTKSFSRDVKDVENLLGRTGLKADIVNASFMGIAQLDLMVSVPTWIGAFEKAKDEGLSDADAIDMADIAVSKTQGSGLPRDMADIQQGPDWKKLLTMFYSYFSAYHGMQTREWKRLNMKQPKSVGRFAVNQLYLTIIPSILIDALFGSEMPDLDDDWDEWAMWSAGSIGKLLFGGITGVRELANSFATGYGYQMSPAMNVAKMTLRAAEQAKQGEWDAAAWKAGAMMAGYLARFPGARAFARAGDVLFDEGTEALQSFEGWWRLLVRGPEKKK